MRLYPCGYAAYAAQIEHLMRDQLHLVMIDTRLKPWSKMPAWREETLKATYGERYRWAGQYLGNLNYKYDGPVLLANPEAGLRGLRHWLQHGYDLLLLCGCAVYEQCHLSTIVMALQAEMSAVEVVLPERLTPPIRYPGQQMPFDVPDIQALHLREERMQWPEPPASGKMNG